MSYQIHIICLCRRSWLRQRDRRSNMKMRREGRAPRSSTCSSASGSWQQSCRYGTLLSHSLVLELLQVPFPHPVQDCCLELYVVPLMFADIRTALVVELARGQCSAAAQQAQAQDGRCEILRGQLCEAHDALEHAHREAAEELKAARNAWQVQSREEWQVQLPPPSCTVKALRMS